MENREKLINVFCDSLELNHDGFDETIEYGCAKWDSVAHMSIVAGLELEFDVMLETDDVIDMSSFVKSMEILGKYGVTF